MDGWICGCDLDGCAAGWVDGWMGGCDWMDVWISVVKIDIITI